MPRWRSAAALVLHDFNAAAGWAGVTAFIFMVFGALAVQVSVLREFPISDSERASWITVTWLTAGLVTVPFAIYFRQPLAIGWTIPGLVFMGALAGRFTLPEFAAANFVAGLTIVALGVAGLGSRTIALVPLPILMAMFGASILQYETRLVETTAADVTIAGPMIIAFVAGRLLDRERFPPVGLAVVIGAVMIIALGRVGEVDVHATPPVLQAPGFDFNFRAILAISLPMVVFVLGLGNVQGLGFMVSEGYRPPLNLTTVLIGLISSTNAVFGGHPASMARTVTAIVAGREAGPLPQRYWAAVIAFVGALGVALATGSVVALIATLPTTYVVTMAGLAILAPFQDAMLRAFSGALRLGAVVAFVVTLSRFTIAGIPAEFWALIAGIVTSSLLEHGELRTHWRSAFSEAHPTEASPSQSGTLG